MDFLFRSLTGPCLVLYQPQESYSSALAPAKLHTRAFARALVVAGGKKRHRVMVWTRGAAQEVSEYGWQSWWFQGHTAQRSVGHKLGSLKEIALFICYNAAVVGQDNTYWQCALQGGSCHSQWGTSAKLPSPAPQRLESYQTVTLSGPRTPSGTLVVAAVTGGPAATTPGTLLGTDDFGHWKRKITGATLPKFSFVGSRKGEVGAESRAFCILHDSGTWVADF